MRILIFVMLGGIALMQLPIELLPGVQPPTIYVTTQWPGVSPEDIESQITRPVEDAVATVQGLRYLSSSSKEGISTVNIEFMPGHDMGQGAMDVLQMVQTAQQSFPQGDPTLTTPKVQRFDPASIPVLVLGVVGVEDQVKLRTMLDNGVKPLLESADGVGAVQVDGGLSRAIMVNFDPQRLLARSLTSNDLVSALTSENQNMPGGTVINGDQELLVRSYGWFQNLIDLADVPVGTVNNRLIPLSEVALVRDSHKEITSYQRLGGQPAASLSILKQSDANTVATVQNVFTKLEDVQKIYPELKFVALYNQATFVQHAVYSLQEAAVLGGGLAMLVVLFFLRSVSSTLVVATSIPVSVISTFCFVYAMGFTLNTMSLVGLALAAGLIVDDAVVVLENIYRKMEQEGLSPHDAAIQGTTQIVSAVISSTMTILVVFFPILLIPGQTGMMFRQFALVVMVAMGFSLLDALTGVPMLCSRLLKKPAGPQKKSMLLRWFEALDAAYQDALRWAMGHRRKVVLTGLGLTLGSLILIPIIGFTFMPTSDTGSIRLQLIMPTGTSLEQTNRAMRQVEEILAKNPNIEAYLTSVGMTSDGQGTRDTGFAWVSLKDDPKRDSSDAVNMQLLPELMQVPGAQAFPFTIDIVNILITGSMGENVELDVFGPDLSQLNAVATEVLARVRPVPGGSDMRNKSGNPAPEMRYLVDRDKARELGLSFSDVATALMTAGEGKIASYYQEGGYRYPIVVQLGEKLRKTPNELAQIIVNPSVESSDAQAGPGSLSASSRGVYLGQVARPEIRNTFPEIDRLSRQRYFALVGTGQGQNTGDLMRNMERALEGVSFPPGYYWDWGTKMKSQQEEGKTMAFAVVLAIVLIYMLLAIQFENLIVPLSIMCSVPLCVVGVLGALFLSATPFSLMAGIGCLMLVGIAVKNGILLVEYTLQSREAGMSREDALLHACPTRLRPILITALAAILGMIPIATRGRGGEMEAPMAIAVVGGLLASTLLTLFVVPMAYLLFDDLERRWFPGSR